MASTSSGYLKSSFLDFGENLVNFEVEYDRSQAFIVCRLYSFSSSSQKFELSSTKVTNSRICVGEGTDHVQCEIIDCQIVKLAETQLSFPFVLLKTWCARNAPIFRAFGLILCGQRLTFTHLDNPVTIPDEGGRGWGPKLASGPSIIWLGQGLFHVRRYQAQAGVKHSWKIESRICNRVIAARLDFDWGPMQNLNVTLLLASQSETISFIRKIRLSTQKNVKPELLDNFKCWPDLHHLLSKSTYGEFTGTTHSEKELGLLLVTSGSRLLQLDCYKASDISRGCKLPMSDVSTLHFSRNLLSDDDYCIVGSRAGKSCVVNLTTFQVVSSSGIPSVADGFCFIHSGRLFRSQGDQQAPFMMAQFEITDLMGVLRPEAEASQASSGQTPALKAMHSRLVDGKMAVSYALAESNDLEKNSNELAHVLRRLTTGELNLDNENKPYLYGLLAGKQVSMTRSISQDSEPHRCHSLDIGTPWQKPVDDISVIGVDVTNTSTQTSMFDLHLVVTVPFRSFQHSSKFFLIDEKYNESLSGMPPVKRLRLEGDAVYETGLDVRGLEPGQRAILTVALSPEVLGHRTKLTLNVAVASKQREGTKVTSSCVGCLPVSVTMQDMVNEEPSNFTMESKGKEALHDLAALNAYTDTAVKLVIISKETELMDIQNILQTRTDLKFNPYLDVLFWKTAQVKILSNAWMTLDKKARLKVHLTIHARDRWQFFKVVHYLYGKLPADILILPDESEPLPALSSSLLNETNLVSSFIGSTPGDVDRDQFKSFTSSPVTLNMDGYQNFRKQLFQLEQKTDNVAASVLDSKNVQTS